MTIASSRLGASDEAKFVLVRVCSVLVIHAELLSLLHLLVILVEALVGVLDDEGVHHRDRGGCAKAVTILLSTLASLFVGGVETTRLHG